MQQFYDDKLHLPCFHQLRCTEEKSDLKRRQVGRVGRVGQVRDLDRLQFRSATDERGQLRSLVQAI